MNAQNFYKKLHVTPNKSLFTTDRTASHLIRALGKSLTHKTMFFHKHITELTCTSQLYDLIELCSFLIVWVSCTSISCGQFSTLFYAHLSKSTVFWAWKSLFSRGFSISHCIHFLRMLILRRKKLHSFALVMLPM